MLTILKVLFLQLVWILIVLFGKSTPSTFVIFAGVAILAIDYVFYKPKISLTKWTLVTIFFLLCGFAVDTILLRSNVIEFNSYSYNYLILWPILLTYYEGFLEILKGSSVPLKAVIGGLGGASAYIGATNLGAFQLVEGAFWQLVWIVFISWFFFFPISLWVYRSKSVLNDILDLIVITSFDKSGLNRHKASFPDLLDLSKSIEGKDFAGANALVSGGTSGIGRSVVQVLSLNQVQVDFIGRSKEKAIEVIDESKNSRFLRMDMGDWSSIRAEHFKGKVYDYIVLNAGAMPEEKVLNARGVELQFASQVVGHMKLLVELKKNNLISRNCRIVWVSSGGMYLKKLDLGDLIDPKKYNKVDTYANVKRAQVTLVEELVKTKEWEKIKIFSMHPGWVDTSGLESSLPGFFGFFKKRLRTPFEGADTILWLLFTEQRLTSGKFYFDRRVVSPYIHKSFSPKNYQRNKLVEMISKYIYSEKSME